MFRRQFILPGILVLLAVGVKLYGTADFLDAKLHDAGTSLQRLSSVWNLAFSCRAAVFASKPSTPPPVKWRRKLEGRLLLASLQNDAGAVYISSGNAVIALDTAGNVTWKQFFKSAPRLMATSSDGRKLYLADAKANLIVLDTQGNIVWERNFPGWKGIFSVSANGAGGHILVVSDTDSSCSHQAVILDSKGKIESAISPAPSPGASFLNVVSDPDGKYLFGIPWKAGVTGGENCAAYSPHGASVAGSFKLYDRSGNLIWAENRREWLCYEYSDCFQSLARCRLPGAEWSNYFTGGISADGAYAFAQDRIYDIAARRIVWQTPRPEIEASVIHSDADGFIVQSWALDIGAPAKLERVSREGQLRWSVPIYGDSVYCDADNCFVPRISPWKGCDIYDGRTGRRVRHIPSELNEVKQVSGGYFVGVGLNSMKVLSIYLYRRDGRLLWKDALPVSFKDSTSPSEVFVEMRRYFPDYDISSSSNLNYILLRIGDELVFYENAALESK